MMKIIFYAKVSMRDFTESCTACGGNAGMDGLREDLSHEAGRISAEAAEEYLQSFLGGMR